MHMQPGSLVYRRAKFATHNLWVTPYDDDQLFPAGTPFADSELTGSYAEDELRCSTGTSLADVLSGSGPVPLRQPVLAGLVSQVGCRPFRIVHLRP